MTLEISPQLPIDTTMTPFWRYIPTSRIDLTFNLVTVVATHFDNMKLTELRRGESEIFAVYAPSQAIEFLQRIVRTPDFSMLKSVVEGHSLVNLYRHRSSLLKENEDKLNYLFWIYRSDHTLKLSHYWEERSREHTNTELSQSSKINSKEYYSLHLGAAAMARHVRLAARPTFDPILKPEELTIKFLEKIVTRDLQKSA